jgi:hypothetical protein
MGASDEKTAKFIFMELNNTWSDFESDASQEQMLSAVRTMKYSLPNQASQLVSAIYTRVITM